ncbi:hypothetical protein J5N97_012742 [Dioscorea zingiberensis]|uniref:Uncharacterized protein n=1 Tax=Dioscorea zingiberensis TaxID=325984 RepID=A0A9D5HI49_9LILI|nr:hypothetical protein J5N97_012742 [Dioscorea zingiberensis]
MQRKLLFTDSEFLFTEALLLLAQTKQTGVIASRSGPGTPMVVSSRFSESCIFTYHQESVSPSLSSSCKSSITVVAMESTWQKAQIGGVTWGLVLWLGENLLCMRHCVFSRVRKNVQSCLALLASRTGSEVSEVGNSFCLELLPGIETTTS